MFKERVLESIENFVTYEILRTNSDRLYYNKEVKRLKLNVRRANNE